MYQVTPSTPVGYVSPRVRFVHQLEEVRDGVLTMGSMVDKAIDYALDSLRRRDLHLAERVIRDDRHINRQRFDIEQSALLLMATQQPMASDLRFLASVLHITTDLERMGDHARGVARLCIKLSPEPPLNLPAELPRMGELCRDRLRRSLDAFVARDAEAALQIAAQDATTDEMKDASYRHLLETMIADPTVIRRATYLLWATHSVERIGDHITNVCERVIFAVTGHMEELTESPRTTLDPEVR
ncbi:MAG: phosphate signaling complex protein PhoU [Chloroflexota bacterium]